MAKRDNAIGRSKFRRSHSPKTAKRKAIKAQMLADRAAKKSR